jgi:hypothetical protein
MADAQSTTGQAGRAGLSIPDDVRAKFPALVDLIVQSESMNMEERQYWINILPIMTPEQLKNLSDILVNERDQLKAIDQKYAKDVEKIGAEQAVRQFATRRSAARTQRTGAEADVRKQEEAAMEDVLKRIDNA